METLDVDETSMHVDQNSAAWPVRPPDADPGTALVLREQDTFTIPPDIRPVIEVAFKDGHWWSIPQELSEWIYWTSLTAPCVRYTWDWGNTRQGSFVEHAEDGSSQATTINRYTLDFESMTQTNVDNQRKRTFRVCWTKDAGPARWTGQITR